MANIYLVLSILSVLFTWSAIVQARRLYFLMPLYFLTAWLTGEMALLHLLLQVGLSSFLAFIGVFSDPSAQLGLGLFALSWLGLVYLHCQAMDTQVAMTEALAETLGEDYRLSIPAQRQGLLRDHIVTSEWIKPFAYHRPGVQVHKNVAYADGGVRNLVDVYEPREEREGGFPILLQVHGGAWMIGSKEEQAKPLMYHMTQRGWLCFAINYRLSPKDDFPAHIVDVKKAIAWIREHAAEFGGNPEYIAITGGSAGGHLSSLAALTPNRQEWQPGFEDVDTTLQAAVPFYGVFDFLDRDNIRPEMSMEKTLADRVMKCTPEQNPELWENGSPLTHVSADAPPMLVVQGTNDSLVWVEEARVFVKAMREVSEQAVAYAELPGAQHAFEIFHSVRTDHAVNGVATFLEWAHANWLAKNS